MQIGQQQVNNVQVFSTTPHLYGHKAYKKTNPSWPSSVKFISNKLKNLSDVEEG